MVFGVFVAFKTAVAKQGTAIELDHMKLRCILRQAGMHAHAKLSSPYKKVSFYLLHYEIFISMIFCCL